jgi:hypothetical protein
MRSASPTLRPQWLIAVTGFVNFRIVRFSGVPRMKAIVGRRRGFRGGRQLHDKLWVAGPTKP